MLSTKHSQSPIYANDVRKSFMKHHISRANSFGLHAATQIMFKVTMKSKSSLLFSSSQPKFFSCLRSHFHSEISQGCPVLLLKSHCPAEFSSKPPTPIKHSWTN